MRMIIIGGAALAVISLGAMQAVNSRSDQTRIRAAEEAIVTAPNTDANEKT